MGVPNLEGTKTHTEVRGLNHLGGTDEMLLGLHQVGR